LKKKQIVFGRKDLSNNEHVCGEEEEERTTTTTIQVVVDSNFNYPKLSCKMWVLAMVYLAAALFTKTLVLFLPGLVLAFLLIKFGRVTSNECST
jgi:hypothetical protein